MKPCSLPLSRFLALSLSVFCLWCIPARADFYQHIVETSDSLNAGRLKVNSNFATIWTNISSTYMGATNLAPTNATSIGVFYRQVGTNFQFLTLKQGTNVILYRDGSNIVFNALLGSVVTNSDQFAPNTTLTIKSGAGFTNTLLYPSGTHGTPITVKGVAAQESPLVDLQDSNGNTLFSVSAAGVFKATLPGSGSIVAMDGSGNAYLTNAASGSGGIAATNPNQFAASTVLAIKSGAAYTNTLLYPSLTTATPLTITAKSAQTGNLLDVKDSSGNVMFGLTAAGELAGNPNSEVHFYPETGSLILGHDSDVIPGLSWSGRTTLTLGGMSGEDGFGSVQIAGGEGAIAALFDPEETTELYSAKGLILQPSGATTWLLRARNSSGVPMFEVFPHATAARSSTAVAGSLTASNGITAQAAVGYTNNPFEVRSSNGAAVAYVDTNSVFNLRSNVVIGANLTIAGTLTNANANETLSRAMAGAVGNNAWELPLLTYGVTVRATNAAGAVSGNTYTLNTSQTNFTAIGGKAVLQGGGGGVTIKDWSLNDNSGDAQCGGSIRFYSDAPLIEVRMVGANASYAWNVLVDGQIAKRDLLPQTGTYGYCVIDFGGVSQARCIEISHDNGAEGFDTISVGANYTIWKPGARPKMLVLGDSVSAGAVVTYLIDTYYSRLGYLLGVDRYQCGSGGTGYTNNNGSSGLTSNYLGRINTRLDGNGQSYDLILCWSSSNDSGPSDTNNLPIVTAAASNTWVRLRALYPTAKLVVTGYTPLRAVDAWRDAAELAVSNTFALWNDNNSLFIPTRAWMSSGSLNLYRYDDDHPNTAGHTFYAGRLAQEIRANIINGSVLSQARAAIYPDNNGYVAIGTTTASSSLDVTGEVRMASALITNTLGVGTSGAALATMAASNAVGSATRAIASFGTNNSGLVVASNNLVGIGTPTPKSFLDVSNAPGQTLTRLAHIGTNDASGFNVATNARIGLGTAFPLAPVHLTNADGNANFLFSGTTKAMRMSFSSGGTTLEGIDPSGVNSYQELFLGGSILYFSLSGTARAALIANGNFGIGTTTPSSSLDVTGGVRAASGIITNTLGVGTATPMATIEASNAVGTAVRSILHGGTNISSGLTVSSNALVGIGTALPATTLDVTGAIACASINATGAVTAASFSAVDFYANNATFTNAFSYTPTVITGVGGANTNFTPLATAAEMVINAFTNVSIRAVMGYDSTLLKPWVITLTNGSGTDRTLEFNAQTNRFRFIGPTGLTNAPSMITNATQVILYGRSVGSNTTVRYEYYAWP